jgi:D-alanyl-lipoteichoic acid acyltransferase DltB (MBOAT superfamily)
MTREAASRTTLLAAFFPYIFLFTTVAYSESLFLFACIASWYFYLNHKTLNASLLAVVATITRMVGIIIALPMFLDMLHQRERKRLLYFLIPSMALFAWLSYCFVETGDWLASITSQSKYWNMYSFPKWLVNIISTQRMVDIPSEISGIIMIILASILIYYGRKIDWRLTVYSVASFLVILYFGAMWSISRYLSFIFPVWIYLGTRTLQGKSRNILTAASCFLFFSIAFLLWYRFLLAQWVA